MRLSFSSPESPELRTVYMSSLHLYDTKPMLRCDGILVSSISVHVSSVRPELGTRILVTWKAECFRP